MEGCDEAKRLGMGQGTLNSERAQKSRGKERSLGGLGKGHHYLGSCYMPVIRNDITMVVVALQMRNKGT